MIVDPENEDLRCLLHRYLTRLQLPDDRLRVTTERRVFEHWLGRRVGSALGGAYAYLAKSDVHLVLINLARIDLEKPLALEIVVAEELVHMRDRLDGDLRRHAKHGHDRIAHRVAALTGGTLDDVRSCILPAQRRPMRFVYACPACGLQVARRVCGTWSCAACSPKFDRRYVLRMVREL